MFGEPLYRRRTNTSIEEHGAAAPQSSDGGGGRSRSVSVTLQDMWRGLRGGSQDAQPDDGGVESGIADREAQDETR